MNAFKHNKSLSIFIFTWNHQGLRIRGSNIDKEIDVDWFLSFTTHKVDFFDPIQELLTKLKPDIVVFGSQEDPMPGSYFHSHYLPDVLAKIGFVLLKKTKLMGVGVETYKALKDFDLKFRGLRLSVYVKDKLYGSVKLEERHASLDQSYLNCPNYFFPSKGAVVSYIKIPVIGTIAFVCVHLPFDAINLKEAYASCDYETRKTSTDYSNYCLNSILKDFIIDKDVQHTFLFGDLNYRVFTADHEQILFSSKTIQHMKYIYHHHDELYTSLQNKEILIPFLEGKKDEGPMFLPTCKLLKPRNKKSKSPSDLNSNPRKRYNVGKGQRQPSWCDRILYYSHDNDDEQISCYLYDRLDIGKTMQMSDHCSVIGLYKIKYPKIN